MADADERTDDDSSVDDGSAADPTVRDPTDGDLPEIDCTLSGAGEERRLAWVREHLLPHLEAVEETEDGFAAVFERSPETYAAVAELAWKESHCCAFATFEVALPPGDGPITWRGRSDRDEGAAFFGDALGETLATMEGAPELG